MKKRALALFLTFQFIVASSVAAPLYTTKAESTASESAGPDGVVYTVVNTSFAFTSLRNPQKDDPTDGLIAQKVEIKTISGREGASPKLEATAWIGGKSKYDTKLWTINDCADSGYQAGDFYWTTKYGMNGAENLLRAYSARTGKYMFSATTEPASVEINIPKDIINRHISYLSKIATDSECRKNDLPKSSIGALTLSDDDKQIDRLLIETDDQKLSESPSISLVDPKQAEGVSELSIWGPAEFSSKSDVVKGFSVKVFFREGVEAIIPVTNDKFDIQKASLPKSVKIRRIDVEKSDAGKS